MGLRSRRLGISRAVRRILLLLLLLLDLLDLLDLLMLGLLMCRRSGSDCDTCPLGAVSSSGAWSRLLWLGVRSELISWLSRIYTHVLAVDEIASRRLICSAGLRRRDGLAWLP